MIEQAHSCTRLAFASVVAVFGVAFLAGCDIGGNDRNAETNPNPGPFLVDQMPAWSPGGERIVYYHNSLRTEDTTDVTGLYVLNLETQSTRLLVEGGARTPDWKPDGSRIAFAAGDIFTIRPDGSGLRRVSGFGSSFSPHWSPDGNTISFGRSGTGREVGTWFAHLRDSTFTRFGRVGGTADWSPNGERIVYNNRDQLWTADTSRSDSTRLTRNDFPANRDAAWSPDGEWIAWSPLPDSGPEIRVMRSSGKDKQKLSGAGRDPAWGPDSDRIVFTMSAKNSDLTALWIMNRDGSGMRQITNPSRNPLN